MPRLDTYISQRGVPATTGQPEVPMALGTQQALISGAENLSSTLAHSAYIQKIKEHTQAVAEQTTAAAQLLLGLDRQVKEFGEGLADPSVNSKPQDKKAYFFQRVGEMEQDTLKAASEVGGVAQQYAMTHIRTITDPHLQAFGKGMDKLRNESGELDLYHTIQGNVDRAIDNGASEEEQKRVLEDSFQRLQYGVQAGFTTSASATPFLNNEAKRLNLESNIRRATADPVASITAIDNGTDTFPSRVRPQVREAAVHALAFQQGQKDRIRQETERLRKDAEENNLKVAEVSIVNGDINSPAALLEYAAKQPLNPSGFHTLSIMLDNKAHNIVSDRGVLTKFYRRLGSFKPEDWPTRSEIELAMNPKFGNPTLSADDGKAIFNHLRTYQDEYIKKGETTYRQASATAKDSIKSAFAPFKGGIMDTYDKLAGEYESLALRDHDENVRKYEDVDPTKRPHPMDWVDDITSKYLVSMVRQGRSFIEADLLRVGLPPEIDTTDKVLSLMKDGKIDSKVAEYAVNRLRLIETYDQIQKTQKSSATTGSTGEVVGGIKRNR